MDWHFDAVRLAEATSCFLNKLGYTQTKLKGFGRSGDTCWIDENNNYLLVEQKSDYECLSNSDKSSGWWKYPQKDLQGQRSDLQGQRSDINIKYNTDDTINRNKRKWMIVIAQLRTAILTIKTKLDFNYRSVFVIPENEILNFKHSFELYHNDQALNRSSFDQNTDLKIWDCNFYYSDRRNAKVIMKVIEIDRLNYFGQIPYPKEV